jgi:AraC family transcriptional activator of mtrCDE
VVAASPRIGLSSADLDRLLTELDVAIVGLAEFTLSRNWALSFSNIENTAIHYNVSGTGRLCVGGASAIKLVPHMLVIIPRASKFRIEEESFCGSPKETNVKQIINPDTATTKYVIGTGESALTGIFGHIRASFGGSMDLFKSPSSPIIECFDKNSGPHENLKLAVSEFNVREIGMHAMVAALLKRVLVTIFRRSMSSAELWAERFPILGDPQISRAFAIMVAEPGAAHSIHSLSHIAGLSRSAFMARFVNVFGISPAAALRRLRMREAESLLVADTLAIDEIANLVGYTNRTSFSRAFRAIYGTDPTNFRTGDYRSDLNIPAEKGLVDDAEVS